VLHAFLATNRSELIERCQKKAVKRLGLGLRMANASDGVPTLLDQIGDALSQDLRSNASEKYEPRPAPTNSDVGVSAANHGVEMMHRGYSIDQVVYEYGDICQAVTELAEELKFQIATEEFRTLNGCLDNAIADAVTSYGSADQHSTKNQTEDLRARITRFLNEERRLLEIASSAFAAIRAGSVGPSGATGNLLVHTLAELLQHGERALERIVLT
jgi:hypothetical protein